MGINSAITGGHKAAQAEEKRLEMLGTAREIMGSARVATTKMDMNAFVEKAVEASEIYEQLVAQENLNKKAGKVLGYAALGLGAVVLPISTVLSAFTASAGVGALVRANNHSKNEKQMAEEIAAARDDLLGRVYVGLHDSKYEGHKFGEGLSSDIATKTLNVPKLKT